MRSLICASVFLAVSFAPALVPVRRFHPMHPPDPPPSPCPTRRFFPSYVTPQTTPLISLSSTTRGTTVMTQRTTTDLGLPSTTTRVAMDEERTAKTSRPTSSSSSSTPPTTTRTDSTSHLGTTTPTASDRGTGNGTSGDPSTRGTLSSTQTSTPDKRITATEPLIERPTLPLPTVELQPLEKTSNRPTTISTLAPSTPSSPTASTVAPTAAGTTTTPLPPSTAQQKGLASPTGPSSTEIREAPTPPPSTGETRKEGVTGPTTRTGSTAATIKPEAQTSTDRKTTEGEKRKDESTTRSTPPTETPKIRTTHIPNEYNTVSRMPQGEPTTSSSYCEKPCPDDYFEGDEACVLFLASQGSYSYNLGRCQAIQNGDMISVADVTPNFNGIKRMLLFWGLKDYMFYTNMYQNNMIRKLKKAQVIWISATSHEMTTNRTIVPKGEELPDVGTICKIPKNCRHWRCPTASALLDAPAMALEGQVPAVLEYEEKLKYKCKNQSVSTRRWEAYCTDRGSIGPAASLYNAACEPDPNVKQPWTPHTIVEIPDPTLTCEKCLSLGTERCVKTPEGEADICICKNGWSGLACWRFPRLCPLMTCPEESVCEERIDYAECVCATERCVVAQRQFNRTEEMVMLDHAVSFVGPSFEFVLRLIMQAMFPEKTNTIQNSLQYVRGLVTSAAGMAYIFGGDPGLFKIDIAERRMLSFLFHFPQIMIHLLWALEVYHISETMAQRSDNNWQSVGKDRPRWDYAWTYIPTFGIGAGIAALLWYANWDTHQTMYTSFGIMNKNFGMLGWASLTYIFFCTYSFWKAMELFVDENRHIFESVKRDNKYETSTCPWQVEDENMVWRNIITCIIGAPIQCMYSCAMLANLAWDHREIKYANLILCFLNITAQMLQGMRCYAPFLSMMRAWENMYYYPTEERYNPYSFRITSEEFARRGRRAYEGMLEKRREAEREDKEEAIEYHRGEIEHLKRKGVPAEFHKHFPEQGPAKITEFEYDPCEENYMSAREREFEYIMWTKEYLVVRPKLGVSVSDACKHVENKLIDKGWFKGDDCPKKQAKTMFDEWSKMMVDQDKIDFVPNTASDNAFHEEQEDNGKKEDLKGLGVGNLAKEAPDDPKKKRLLDPIKELFLYSCPDKEEFGVCLVEDEFGRIDEKVLCKSLPVMTRAQENHYLKAINDERDEYNKLYDTTYSDDTRFDSLEGKPYEKEVKIYWAIVEAFPEGRRVKSINPRKKAYINDYYFRQDRPDLIGPKLPQYYLPAGPLLRRHWVEETMRVRREWYFNLLQEQAALRRAGRDVRNMLVYRARRNACTIM